jgi:hypothetical protein
MNLTKGQKLTVIDISDGMANTIKGEITITEVLPEPRAVRFGEKTRVALYKPRGGRKEFYLDTGRSTLVFEGWSLPIVPDFDIPRAGGSKSFCGNACLNLGAPSIDVLRDYIDNKNLNDAFTEKAIVLFVEVGSPCDGDGVLAYPDADMTRGHAVIDRIKEKAENSITA